MKPKRIRSQIQYKSRYSVDTGNETVKKTCDDPGKIYLTQDWTQILDIMSSLFQ